MPESPKAKLSSKYKAFMYDGTVTLYIGPDRKKMEMHRKLLASISPELDKHVNNNMKEGIEGKIHFPEEGEDTLALFSEWAYTGRYAFVDDKPASQLLDPNRQPPLLTNAGPWPEIRLHLQLYVFADKFNIPALKQLAKANLSIAIGHAELTRGDDVAGLGSVIEYAYHNLPDSDSVPKFLARYTSWKLPSLRGRDEFIQLISTHPEFAKEFLMNVYGLSATQTLS